MSAKNERMVTRDWTWFTDYGYFWSKWTINVEGGNEVEVGVGMKIGGKPRGGRFKVKGHYEFTTYGIGAIHVRTTDPLNACTVRVDQGEAGTIPVHSDPSNLKAALELARKLYRTIK